MHERHLLITGKVCEAKENSTIGVMTDRKTRGECKGGTDRRPVAKSRETPVVWRSARSGGLFAAAVVLLRDATVCFLVSVAGEGRVDL